MAVDHETVELHLLVWNEERPLKRSPIGCALDGATRADEVDQDLVRGDAARERQSAIELIAAVASDVDDHVVARRAVDGYGMAIADAEAGSGEQTRARGIKDARTCVDRGGAIDRNGLSRGGFCAIGRRESF